MKKSSLKNVIFLFLAALIWGITFVPQSISAKYMDAYSVLFFRSIIGIITLLPITIYSLIKDKKNGIKYKLKDVILGGLLCGLFLVFSSLLQQIGLENTSASKTSFITSVYIVLVPIFSFFIYKKLHLNILFSVIIAFIGLFLLSFNFNEDNSFNVSDLIIFGGAILFAFQIISCGIFSKKVNCLLLSCEQLFVQAIVSLIFGFLFKGSNWLSLNTYNIESIISILFIGIMSSGVAYTFQLLGQKNYDPTKASLIMSLESVFGSCFSVIIYSFYKYSDVNQFMSMPQIIGGILVFISVIISQIDFSKIKKKKE